MSASACLLSCLLLVLLSASAASGLTQQGRQHLTWDEFVSSQHTGRAAVPRGRKPPRPGRPPVGPRPPPKPGPGPTTPGPITPGPGPAPGPLPPCSGSASDPCVIPAGIKVRST